MATFEPRKVTKPFHLSLEEYKRLFPEFKARESKIIIVALSPMTNLSISLNPSADEKGEISQQLAQRGHMIISVGEKVEAYKEGELIFIPTLALTSFAFNRELIVNDVFPRVRNYVLGIINQHDVEAAITHDPDKLVEIERKVNITLEQNQYDDAVEAIKEREQNPNKFNN